MRSASLARLTATEEDAYRAVIETVEGDLTEPQLAGWFRACTRPARTAF